MRVSSDLQATIQESARIFAGQRRARSFSERHVTVPSGTSSEFTAEPNWALRNRHLRGSMPTFRRSAMGALLSLSALTPASFALTTPTAPQVPTQDPCNEACLTGFMDAYL